MLKGYFEKTLIPSLQGLSKFYRQLVGTGMYESDMADILTNIQQEATEFDVKIGSYPKWKPDNVRVEDWKVKVVVSILGQDKSAVDKFTQMVKKRINGFLLTTD